MALDAADPTSHYLHDLTEHIKAFQNHLVGSSVEQKALYPSFVPPSGYWTPSDKEKFFHSLAVNSRFRPDLIAFDVGTKNVTDVCIYLGLLEQGAAGRRTVRGDLAIATSVPEKWIDEEDRLCEGLQDAVGNVKEGKDLILGVLDSTKRKIVDRILEEEEQSADESIPARDPTPPPASDNADTPEAELSPKSGRLLRKRLYMRRKRASQKGVEPDLESELLPPGVRSQRGQPQTPEPDADEQGIAEEQLITAGRKEWGDLGIDAEELISRGLGFFNLDVLGNLMKYVCNLQTTEALC